MASNGDSAAKDLPANTQNLPGTSPMETEPQSRDLEKRAQFRKFLKVRTMVFGSVAAALLPIGLPLAVVFRGPESSNRVVWATGILMSSVGAVCALIFFIYLPIFMRVMAVRSESVVYQTRGADALGNYTYPRQKDVVTEPSSASHPVEFHQAAENPHYSPSRPLLRPGCAGVATAPPPSPPTEEPPRYDYVQRDTPGYFNLPYPAQ